VVPFEPRLRDVGGSVRFDVGAGSGRLTIDARSLTVSEGAGVAAPPLGELGRRPLRLVG
jgi:hypothetical protein